MKVYGPFHALNNPLVAIALGLRGAEDAMQVYDRYKEAHKNDFLTRALLTGQPVTELPGGPFRQLASKVTGGLIHPNIEATGSDLAQEILALRKQEGENIREAGSLANIREKTGPKPFEVGSPYAKTALRLGLGDLTGPTRAEQQFADTQEYRRQELGLKTPEAAGERAKAALLATEPIRTRIAGETTEERLRVAGGPLGISTAGKVAETRAIGTARGKNIALEDTKLSDMRDYNIYDNRFRNLGAISPETKYGDIKGPKYSFKKGSKGDLAFAAVPSAIKDLDALDAMVMDPKNSDIFPIAGTPASLWAQGKQNWRRKYSDPRLNRFYSYNLDLVKSIRAANGGRVMQAELGMGSQYWPNPGMGTMLARSGMLGRLEDDTGLDATPAETASEMHAKIVKAKHQIIEDAQGTARGGIPESDDIDMAIDSAEGD